VDPQEKAVDVFKEISSIYQIYFTTPVFGVDFTVESENATNVNDVIQPKAQEDLELIDEHEDTHAIAAFYSQTGTDDDAKFENIFFDPNLGLAMEEMVNGLTLDNLWRVI
jgi:hypothetical protein